MKGKKDPNIKDLLEKRRKLRAQGKFREADEIRKQIEQIGHRVIDVGGESILEKIEDKASGKNFLVLFGSGEISPAGRGVHEYVFEQIGKKEINIAIVSTPAGFQPNVKVVHEEIRDFFLEHLTNFHPKIEIVYANNREQANDLKVARQLENKDYIFIGPGSPTYATRNLRKTLLLDKLLEQIKKGVTLSLASAAAISFSKYALPVYEIYKAGADLYWEKGLDFYGNLFKPLTIIPHYNNNEGGAKNDTSRSYMGKARFEKLFKILSKNEEIWGIDEQTGVVIDLKTKKIETLGKGKLHSIKE